MKKDIVVFAGFSSTEYIKEIRDILPPEEYELACIYKRELSKEKRDKYLKLFDHLYTLESVPADILNRITLVTCTQERDIETYIELYRLKNWITEEQSVLWSRVVNKRKFKEDIQKVRPDLVPNVSIFNQDTPLPPTIKYPLVIKPTNMTGSAYVSIINNQTELKQYLTKITKYNSDIKKVGRLPELITEEFIEGSQYSMNVYIDQLGKVVFCPLIRVIPAFELEHNDTYSALQYNTTLPKEETDSLYNAINFIVEYFKITNTSAHFDCILSSSGWKICEVGLRIGGKRQPLFLESYGFSHIKNDIYNRAGKEIYLGERKSTVAIIQKTPDRFGHMKEIIYSIPTHKHLSFKLDKLKERNSYIGPVSKGGVTAFRAFISGVDEETVIEASKSLFESIDFKFRKTFLQLFFRRNQ